MEQVLITQNPHWEGGDYDQPFFRLHDDDAISNLRVEEIQVITGIRRCGKSTLLKRMITHLLNSTDPKSLLYVNFDDPNYTDVCQDPKLLYDIVVLSEKLTGVQVTYLFLDEIQNVSMWEKYVKSVFDSQRFKKIVITGSNADLLNSDYATLLSGRYIETRLYPLRFEELLRNKKIETSLNLHKQKASVLSLLDDMLIFGGFPRIQLLSMKQKRQTLLQSYYETILLKDCISNHDVRDTKTMSQLAHYLVTNNATLYSYNSLKKALGGNENTISQFIHIFQNAYFLEEVYQFSYSLKKQMRAKKKTYCIDNGLITAISFKFMDNTAKLLENLVYTELKKRFGDTIYFYNDSVECDFVIHNEQHQLAIQVCYQVTPENRMRELRGLKMAMDQFSIPTGLIITYDQLEQVGEDIKLVPFWQWFCGL